MQNLNKSGEKQQQINESNPITLLKNPQKFKETFLGLVSSSSEALKSQDYDKAIKTLSKCIDMFDLGKNILKDQSKYWKLCLYANFACAYQGTWKMQKCNKYCEKIEEELEKLLQSVRCKEQNLNLTKHLIRIKFQHCAILSQLNQHDKALQMCKSTLPTLQTYIQSILQYTQTLMNNHADKKSSQIVHFSRQVCTFANQILKNLLRSLNEPISECKQKSSFYYWQKNPQNNQQQVRKKYVSNKNGDTCKRSILGVNKVVHWIDEFNIGTIMHMNELSINDFEQNLPIEEYIFKDKLYQTVIHCSVAHFTIATEMRFIESAKEKEKDDSQIQEKDSPNLNFIHKKYGYEKKSQLFQLSQLYHLKAIGIMSENIKSTVPYISHLIKSYDKHYIYKKQLQPILAIIQESALSVSESYQKPKKFQEEDNYFNYLDYNNHEDYGTNNLILGELENDSPQEHGREELEELQSKMIPNFGLTESRNQSIGKKRHRSMGRPKPKTATQPAKAKKEQKKGGKKKTQRRQIGEKQLRIKHESCTQIKLVFKKKK